MIFIEGRSANTKNVRHIQNGTVGGQLFLAPVRREGERERQPVAPHSPRVSVERERRREQDGVVDDGWESKCAGEVSACFFCCVACCQRLAVSSSCVQLRVVMQCFASFVVRLRLALHFGGSSLFLHFAVSGSGPARLLFVFFFTRDASAFCCSLPIKTTFYHLPPAHLAWLWV